MNKRLFKHVPSSTPTTTPVRIAIIGECPGTDETYYGKPYCGAGGRLLNSALRSANIDRDTCYVGYLFDEQPDRDDPTKCGWYKDEVRLEYNRVRLAADLVACNPTVIVLLGAGPLWAFTGEKLISGFRGAPKLSTEIVPGVKTLPTFDPETIQKAYHLLPLLVKDLIKANLEADLGPSITYPRLELLVEPTLQDVQEFAAECYGIPKLSVDIETGWSQITSLSLAPSTTRALSIPFVDLRHPTNSYWPTAADEFRVWRIIQAVLENPVPKVLQNGGYDVSWLWEKKKIKVNNYRYDTRIRHKVLYPELPADLGSMGASYTRIGAWKGWTSHHKKEIKQDG